MNEDSKADSTEKVTVTVTDPYAYADDDNRKTGAPPPKTQQLTTLTDVMLAHVEPISGRAVDAVAAFTLAKLGDGLAEMVKPLMTVDHLLALLVSEAFVPADAEPVIRQMMADGRRPALHRAYLCCSTHYISVKQYLAPWRGSRTAALRDAVLLWLYAESQNADSATLANDPEEVLDLFAAAETFLALEPADAVEYVEAAADVVTAVCGALPYVIDVETFDGNVAECTDPAQLLEAAREAFRAANAQAASDPDGDPTPDPAPDVFGYSTSGGRLSSDRDDPADDQRRSGGEPWFQF